MAWARFLVICLAVLLPATARVAAGEEVMLDGIPHIRNGATPAEGCQTWHLDELWQAGSDDDEMLLGVVTQALSDEEGNIYMLDRQLCQIHVYSADGRYLRSLSREGEGPGEIRNPTDMAFLPDGGLGVVQPFPSRIAKIALDGTPRGAVTLGGKNGNGGGLNQLRGIEVRGGSLVLCGTEMSFGENSLSRTSFLGVFEGDGTEKVRLLEKRREEDFGKHEFVERDEYFVDRGGWAVGPDGKIYAAPERDNYAVHVYAPDGTLERVIERESKPRKRTAADKEQIAGGVVMIINGRRVEVDADVEDYDPCVVGLEVAENGDLWVLSSGGSRDQPDGIFQTYDVFDPAGHFIRQVAIACEHDSRNDRLFLIGERAIVVKGFLDAMRSLHGATDAAESDAGSEDESELLGVICCAIRK